MKTSGTVETEAPTLAEASESARYLITAVNQHTPVAEIGQSNFTDMVYPSIIDAT